MKRSLRFVLLILAIVLLFAAVPQPTAWARPKSLKLKYTRVNPQIKVHVQIDDMVFNGTLNKLTNEEIDQLIAETLAEMGMTEAEFDAYSKHDEALNNMSQEQISKLRNALITLVSAIPATGLTEGALLIKFIDQLAQGDRHGAAKTVYDYFMLTQSGGTPHNMLTMFQEYVNVADVMNTFYRSGQITEFYKRLDLKLIDLMKDKPYILFVNNQRQLKEFELFEEQMVERWLLTMTLLQPTSGGTQYFVSPGGDYKGVFNIDIEYDLQLLPHALRQFNEKNDAHLESDNKTWTIKSNGIQNASREMSGEAEVSIDLTTVGRVYNINIGSVEDNKSVSIKDMVIHVYSGRHGGPGSNAIADLDFIFNGDVDGMSLSLENGVYVDSTETVYWDPVFISDYCDWKVTKLYNRGDFAKTGPWKLYVIDWM